MLAITSANVTTSATILWALTSAKAIRSAYMYGNNTKYHKYWKYCGKTFSHIPPFGVKNTGISFSSDLRKPCWITGKSFSPKFKKCPVPERIHIYIIYISYIYYEITKLAIFNVNINRFNSNNEPV